MHTKPRRRTQDLTIGLLLVALGVIFLADRVTDVEAFRRYWPLLLILLGAGHLVSSERRSGTPWLLATGVIMLLHTTDVLRLGDSWPLFVVAAGLGWIWSGWRGADRERRSGRCQPEGEDVR